MPPVAIAATVSDCELTVPPSVPRSVSVVPEALSVNYEVPAADPTLTAEKTMPESGPTCTPTSTSDAPAIAVTSPPSSSELTSPRAPSAVCTSEIPSCEFRIACESPRTCAFNLSEMLSPAASSAALVIRRPDDNRDTARENMVDVALSSAAR